MRVPCSVMSERYSSGVITPPDAFTGQSHSNHPTCACGYTRWKRMSSDSTTPNSTATSERKKYWRAITRWSVEKILFRKANSAT